VRHHGTIGQRRGDSGFNLGRVFLIVIGIHVVFGGGLLWMAKTQTGQEFAKTYNIKLFSPPLPPPKHEEPPKPETPPPPPPEVAQPKVEMPKLAAAAPSAAPAPQIGGDGGPSMAWGGKFAGGNLDGPEGAYNAGVTSLFRSVYQMPPGTRFGPAVVQLQVTGSGQVQEFRLAQSSGSPAQDQALLAAAEKVKARGTPPPPDQKPRSVTVRIYPY
jgi:TonB family protein